MSKVAIFLNVYSRIFIRHNRNAEGTFNNSFVLNIIFVFIKYI